MPIIQDIVTRIGKPIIEARIREEVQRIKESIDRNEEGFRKLTGADDRDLSPIKHERHLKLAYYLYMSNPLARRILEYEKVYVVGNGIKVIATDSAVNKVIQKFWTDTDNNWDLKQGKRVLELGLFGEQIYPVFIDYLGHVKLGFLDPMKVAEVMLDPENAERRTAVRMYNNSGSGQERIYPIIQWNDYKETYEPRTGGTFYFCVNSVSGSARGFSDLLALEDWIDAYDQVLFKFVERTSLLQQFVWDITLTGASDPQIKLRQAQINKLRPGAGACIVHSDKESWEAKTPDLRARENIEEARQIKNIILAGAGFPEFFFSEGEMTTRATALAQGAPTYKVLLERQTYVKYMLTELIKYVIWQAKEHLRLPQEANESFQVIMPDLELVDFPSSATALAQIATSLSIALERGIISQQSAQLVFAFSVSKIGIEIDGKIEVSQLKEEWTKQTGNHPSIYKMLDRYIQLKESGK